MNILYIHTHDSGRYLQPYGYDIPTPHIMTLARQGTLFRNAFCAGPTCSPSRAGLLTGMTPHSAGILGLAHRGFQLRDYTRHLAAYLRGNGFYTVLCGHQHEAPNDKMLGYDALPTHGKTYPNTHSRDIDSAKQAAAFLHNAPADRPFLLNVGLFSTHRPYPEPDAAINPNYIMPPFPVADTPESRADMAGYIQSARTADDCVGIVLDALTQSGHADDTVVVFTTDHGIAFPFMKCHLYDTGIGVSLIVRYPGNPAAGAVSDSLISQLDLFPTLCELAGVAKPDWLQGYSMRPVFSDSRAEIRDEIYAEINYHAAYEPARCIRTKQYKLIKYYDYHNHVVPSNTDASPSKQLLLNSGWSTRPRTREMLFDLYLDPVERVNLIGDSNYQSTYDTLSERLWRWMQATDDPLLTYRHRIPAPADAIVNTLTATDANNTALES